MRATRLVPLTLFFFFLFGADAHATTRVHVRGTARIDARASRSNGQLVLAGTLFDDASQPLSGEKVTLSVQQKAASSALSLAGAFAPERCGEAPGPGPVLERNDTVIARTDAAGRFCVKLPLPVDVYVARLGFEANGNIDATQVELPVDLALRPLTLRFDPEPTVLHLEGPTTVLEAVATTDSEEASSAPALGLTLTLTNEAGTALASGTTNGSGRTRFAFSPAQLGPPGRGELRVAFPGNAEIGSSVHVAQIERHLRVGVAAAGAPDGRLPEGSPEDGVGIDVTVQARGDSRVVPTGTVEARIGDSIVGAAQLESAKARVVVTFSTPSSEVPISLHFSADAPWYEPDGDLVLTLPVRGPSPWRRAPLVLAGLAVIAWLVMGRASPSRSRKAATTSPSAHPPPLAGEARLEVVRELRGREGWTGRVFDAHDGTPVEGARVSIDRPGFMGKERIANAETGADGSFRLDHLDAREGDRLSIEGPLHSELAQPVPPSGELAVALVLRKRALLDRLVDWAKRRGRPFDGPPEPTPGHVRRAAGADFPVARWADAVERAAYSGTVVDAKVESEVERLAPPKAG